MTPENKERLRIAVLTYLAARPVQSFLVTAVTNFLHRDQMIDFHAGEEDVREALAVLEGLALVSRERAPLGSSTYWRATSQGVLHHERAQG